jgi:hypothetical protein
VNCSDSAVMTKSFGLAMVPDEIYHPGTCGEPGTQVPLWAARHRSGAPHSAVRRAPICTRMNVLRARAATGLKPQVQTLALTSKGKRGKHTT